MEFECPKCGWRLEGGDELGVIIYPPDGTFEVTDADERFFYCFHCGEKVEQSDTIERINKDVEENPTEYCERRGLMYSAQRENDATRIAMTFDLLRRQRKLIERG